jgi:hypothetical protein
MALSIKGRTLTTLRIIIVNYKEIIVNYKIAAALPADDREVDK